MREWRKFGIGDYEVNEIGEVRRATASINTAEGRMKKPCKSSNGYMIVGCFSNGKRTNVLVHRAVAEAFIGPCPNGWQVNHKDGNKCNNRLENLEYVSVSGNMIHAIREGLHVIPATRGTSRRPAYQRPQGGR